MGLCFRARARTCSWRCFQTGPREPLVSLPEALSSSYSGDFWEKRESASMGATGCILEESKSLRWKKWQEYTKTDKLMVRGPISRVLGYPLIVHPLRKVQFQCEKVCECGIWWFRQAEKVSFFIRILVNVLFAEFIVERMASTYDHEPMFCLPNNLYFWALCLTYWGGSTFVVDLHSNKIVKTLIFFRSPCVVCVRSVVSVCRRGHRPSGCGWFGSGRGTG